MKRVLRSSTKKSQSKEDSLTKIGVSKNSKATKITSNTVLEVNTRHSHLNGVLSVGSILSRIFSYSEFSDLINFNTVCKSWNQLISPIIYRSINLQRRQANICEVHSIRFKKPLKADIEVSNCISNNAKYASFVEEFKLKDKLKPQKAIEFFQTFKYITCLTLETVRTSQDVFFSIISPLTQLKELNLRFFDIIKIPRIKINSEVVRLPLSFNKLVMECINLNSNSDRFIQTINSHSNLIEFSFKSMNINEFLEPFCKNYPSLKIFEYDHKMLESSQSLLKVFESNSQLINLKLGLVSIDNSIIYHINHHLINLEDLSLSDIASISQDNSLIYLSFTQPTKIKRLSLTWSRLSSCSINSILFNCPDLEELSLILFQNFFNQNTITHLNLTKPTKIKKLLVTCNSLSDASLESILLNSPNLMELEICLYKAWKGWMKIIGERCINLEKLTISPSLQLRDHESENLIEDIFESEFLRSSSRYKTSLTHLTLKQFKYSDSKSEYFNNFKKLRSIKFPFQAKNRSQQSNNEFIFDENLWPNYKFVTKDRLYNTDIELINLNL